MAGPEWVPTGEVRWVNRKVADAVGADLKPVPLYERVLQQRFKWSPGMDVYMVPEYEWRDVSVESE